MRIDDERRRTTKHTQEETLNIATGDGKILIEKNILKLPEKVRIL